MSIPIIPTARTLATAPASQVIIHWGRNPHQLTAPGETLRSTFDLVTLEVAAALEPSPDTELAAIKRAAEDVQVMRQRIAVPQLSALSRLIRDQEQVAAALDSNFDTGLAAFLQYQMHPSRDTMETSLRYFFELSGRVFHRVRLNSEAPQAATQEFLSEMTATINSIHTIWRLSLAPYMNHPGSDHYSTNMLRWYHDTLPNIEGGRTYVRQLTPA